MYLPFTSWYITVDFYDAYCNLHISVISAKFLYLRSNQEVEDIQLRTVKIAINIKIHLKNHSLSKSAYA